MKQLSASGAIGLLLTLLIIAVLFIIMMPTLKSTGSASLTPSSIKQESIEDEVNQKLNEIQNMRKESQQLPVEEY